MATGDLCSLDDVRRWLTLSSAQPYPITDDALIERLVTAASAFITDWINRPILSATWREVRDGTGGCRMAMAYYPITAVASLTIDGRAIQAAPADGGFGAGYVFNGNALTLRGYCFTRRPQNVIATYTAGYDAAPADIRQACIDLVCWRYRERTRIGEVSKVMGGETVSYSQADMSAAVKTLLMQYRRVSQIWPLPTLVS